VDFLANLTIWHYLIAGVAALGAVWFFAGPKLKAAIAAETSKLGDSAGNVGPDSLGSGFAHLRELDALYEAANVPVDERRKLLLDGVARLYGPSEAKP
jgi:hypothetical protein